jgi:hypothetical protein
MYSKELALFWPECQKLKEDTGFAYFFVKITVEKFRQRIYIFGTYPRRVLMVRLAPKPGINLAL